jgi:predicted nucleic acid-binding protein
MDSGRTLRGRQLKVALDTNVFIYLDAIATDPRGKIVDDLLDKIPAERVMIPAQVLGEYVRVLIRKHGFAPAQARENLQVLLDTYETIDTTSEMIASGADLVTVHQRSFWDAVIPSSAAGAGCRILLSDDRDPGFTWAGITIVNPFATPPDSILDVLLADISG